MTNPEPRATRSRIIQIIVLTARLILGALFIYMGLNKALNPVDFLKLLRQYELVQNPVLLNLAAAGLPWFEFFCGILLVLGIGVRGAALLMVAMLVPFTAIVIHRALALHAAGTIPFCAIKFDCGCGGGEVFICRKIAENTGLILLGLLLVARQRHPLCLRSSLFQPSPARS